MASYYPPYPGCGAVGPVAPASSCGHNRAGYTGYCGCQDTAAYPGTAVPRSSSGAAAAASATAVACAPVAMSMPVATAPVFPTAPVGAAQAKWYCLQQKLGSLTGNMHARDQSGRPAFKFHGKWITMLDAVTIKDGYTGRPIGCIKERASAKKLVNRPKYVIETAGAKAAIKKDILLGVVHDNFTVNLNQGGKKRKLRVKSNWFSWEWKFYLGGSCIAQVNKRFLHKTDTYEIQISPSIVDPLIIVSLAVIIDRVCFGELTIKGLVNTASHLPQNPFSRFPVSHAQW